MDFYNLGGDSGFVVGAFGEDSIQVRDLADPADLATCEPNAGHLALFDYTSNESRKTFTQRICRSIKLAVHHGRVIILLGKCRDLVQDPRQPRSHTRETDEGDAETHKYFHFYQTHSRGGHNHTRQV